MFIWIIIIPVVVIGIAWYLFLNSRRTETQRFYAAAYKMIQETQLEHSIKSQKESNYGGQKIMLYLKWKDDRKQGYVFDPEAGVRIGRTPGVNTICIRQQSVSGQHCLLFLSEGRLAVQDYDSRNGTWIKRGLRKHRINGAEFLFSGDCLIVGDLKIYLTIFVFDMAYM